VESPVSIGSEDRPIFQMQLGLRDHIGLGWLFSDETNWFQTPSFTLPWKPQEDFSSFKYVIPGEIGGEYNNFELRYVGSIFLLELEGRTVRFAIHDPLGPLDFRGFPFLRSFPYIGKHKEVLKAYKLSEATCSFIPLMPLDLMVLDELYLSSRLLLVGVTAMFGPHVQANPTLGRTDELTGEDLIHERVDVTHTSVSQDRALIEAVKGGDAKAFGALVTAYSPLVFRLALRMTHNREDAEEVTQEAFLQSYRKLGTLKQESNLRTWLMRIATNLVLDQIRKKRRDESSLEALYPEPKIVEKAVSELAPALRTVFVLRELEGFSYTEVAKSLGLPESEVKSRLHRARVELRELLNRRHHKLTSETIEKLRKSAPEVLPEEFGERLQKEVQRLVM
jgi:RNA polymerase sigma-70 factor (ECF subfamily)